MDNKHALQERQTTCKGGDERAVQDWSLTMD